MCILSMTDYMFIAKPDMNCRENIETILRASGVFTDSEVICALELFDAYIENEDKNGYHFL